MESGFYAMVVAGVFLLAIACISSIIFRKLKIPYTIGLVAIGILLSWFFSECPQFAGLQRLRLNYDLIMYVLLPALIFDASVNMDTKLLRKNLTPTLALAAPGLVIATVITGLLVYWLTPLNLAGSMLFGALISATDPVAVISLFELVGAPKRLRILVDGESLFNDATAIVMFNIVKGIIVSGVALNLMTVWNGTLDFVIVFVGGLLIGAAIGYIMMLVIYLAKDDPLLEVGMSTIVAYAAFLVADKGFGVSGVMSVMGAGMVISYFGSSRFTPEVKSYMKQFWSFMSFVANSLIFLLLGFTEDLILLSNSIGKVILPILAAVLAIQVARLVVVFGLCPLLGKLKNAEKISLPYQLVMFWGGLRGAVPLALVFSLSPDMPGRTLIVQITLGVVLFTLLVQGTTIKSMLCFFKLDKPDGFLLFSKWYALLTARKAGLQRLEFMKTAGRFDRSIVEKIEAECGRNLELQTEELQELNQMATRTAAVSQLIWTRAFSAERETYEVLFNNKFLSEDVFRKLDFQLGQLLESVYWSQRPPEKLIRQPLEIRIRKKFFRFISRFSWSRKYFAAYCGKALSEDVLMLLTLQFGGQEAIRAVENLAGMEFLEATEQPLQNCRNYYQNRQREVEKTLRELYEQNRTQMPEIEAALARQSFYAAEQYQLEELQESGEIPEPVAGELLAVLKERCDAERRRINQLCITQQ